MFIVCTANLGEEDGTIVTEFADTSFFSKMAHLKIEFNKDAFLNYLDRYLESEDKSLVYSTKKVSGFLEYQSDLMFLNLPDDPCVTMAFPTPRGIDRFISCFRKVIANYKLEDKESIRKLQLGSSIVGLDWINTFKEYLEKTLSKTSDDFGILDSAQRLFNSPKSKIPKNIKQKIMNLPPTHLANMGSEVVDIFKTQSLDSMETQMEGFKFELLIYILSILPKDSIKAHVKVLNDLDSWGWACDKFNNFSKSTENILDKLIEFI